MTAISKAWHLGAGAALLVGTLMVGRLALPEHVLACYCTPPETVAAYRTDLDVVIVSGTVVALDVGHGQFGIERVFKGPVPAPAMPIANDTSSCGIHLEVGRRMVIAAHVTNGMLEPSVCMSNALIPSAAADALIADAEAVYGVARFPAATMNPNGEPSSLAKPSADVALPLVLVSLLIGVLLLFGAIVVLARRGRRPA